MAEPNNDTASDAEPAPAGAPRQQKSDAAQAGAGCRTRRFGGFGRGTGLIAVGFALLALLWVLLPPTWVESLQDHLWDQSPQARIYVEPPQVYTRERLVNDRFRELNWLENTLDNLGSTDDRAPSTRLRDERRRRLGVAAAPADDPAAAPRESLPTQLDQNDVFNLDFQRRVAVRSEIMNTLLDDGHDLAGSTLYRLNFDVSIIPRRNARGFGLVAIDVAPGGCDDVRTAGSCNTSQLGRLVRAYRRLLNAWEQDLQAFLSKVYRSRTAVQPGMSIMNPFSGDPVPKERMSFNWYLKARTVETFLDLVVGADCAVAGMTPADRARCLRQCGEPDHRDQWQCNAALRRDAARSALDWPGAADRLPGELSLRFEQGFGTEIGHFSEAMTATLQLAELRRFISSFHAFNMRCRSVVGLPESAPGPAASDAAAPPPAARGPSGPGRAAYPCPESRDDADALLRGLNDAGIDMQTGSDACPALDLVVCLAGLNGGDDCSRECVANSSIQHLLGSISASHGCASGAANPPWDARRNFSTVCPSPSEPQLANLHGLVQLAGRLERVRYELLENVTGEPVIATLPESAIAAAAADAAGTGEPAQNTSLPRSLLDQRVDQVYTCLYSGRRPLTPELAIVSPCGSDPAGEACAAFAAADAACAALLWPATEAPAPVLARVERAVVRRTDAADVPASQVGLSAATIQDLFGKAFADFFVDRLRRNDIPGYQPSPPVDRFFDIRTAGCEGGSCDVMISRKRWLTETDRIGSGDLLRQRVNACAEGEGAAACRRRELAAVLPDTLTYCHSDAQIERCKLLISAALAAAAGYEPDRSVLRPADALSNFARYEVRLEREFQQRSAQLPCRQVQHPAADCPDLGTPADIRVVWDLVETINALEFKAGLAARAGNAGVKVYAVEPRTRGVAAQESVRRVEQLRTTLRLGLRLGQAQVSDSLLDGIGEMAQSLDRVAARNTVIGFGHLRGDPAADAHERHATFGWMFLPNRLEPGGWLHPRGRATHAPGSYRLSAVLSLPSWWTEVKLNVRQCWGVFGHISQSVRENPYAGEAKCTGDAKSKEYGFAPAGQVGYFVELPASTERVNEVFEFEVTKVPYIDSRQQQGDLAEVEAGRAGQLVIEGGRLWRGTMVTLGDQQADEIVVLPDMRGVVAKFKCVLPPPGAHHVTTYGISSGDSRAGNPQLHGPKPAKLTVWTAQGNAVDGAVIWPFKQRVPGEQPCWLDADFTPEAAAGKPATQGTAASAGGEGSNPQQMPDPEADAAAASSEAKAG